MFNKSFGATFLTGTGQESAFAYHIHQYADVYTSKPENFLLYPPESWLHVPFHIKIMPHHVKVCSHFLQKNFHFSLPLWIENDSILLFCELTWGFLHSILDAVYMAASPYVTFHFINHAGLSELRNRLYFLFLFSVQRNRTYHFSAICWI